MQRSQSKKRYSQIIIKGSSHVQKPYNQTPYEIIKYNTEQQQSEFSKQDKHSKNKPTSDHVIQRIQMQDQEQQMQRPWSEVPCMLIIMISYLYFIQGVLLAIPSTMPFIYKNLPNYDVLSIFALSNIPFSLKFITAPFIEKFNFPIYGKRKTYIISSQILSSIFLFACSFMTEQSHQIHFAFGMLVVIFLITLQDIALDALSIKQIRSASLTGAIVVVCQGSGVLIGSMAMLKLTSVEFAQNIVNRQHPLMNIQDIMHLISVMILIPTLLIQFYFKQTVLEQQLQVSEKSFWQILRYYRIFCNIESKHCRMFLFFILFNQSSNFVLAGYDYQLIKAGFSKDQYNSIQNLTQIPITIIAIFLSKLFPIIGIMKVIVVCNILNLVLYFWVYIFFPTDAIAITFFVFVMGLIGTSIFITTTIMINSYPKSGVMGMFITMLASGSNLGQNVSLHTKLTGILTWKVMALIGLVFTALTIIIIPYFFQFVQQGSVGVNGEIRENQQNQRKTLVEEQQ